MKNIEYDPVIVDLVDVPARQNELTRVWQQRFKELPAGKAAMLKYNNHQRAHQVQQAIMNAAKYWKYRIGTRVIHAEPAIHDTEGWLLYYWKKEEEK